MSGTAGRRLIYVLERFPGDTLNFVYNEIAELEAAGFAIDIHSLLPCIVCPEEAERYRHRTTAVRPVPASAMIRAWTWYLLRRPAVLLSTVAQVVADSEGGPRKMMRSFAHAAIGVRFAWMVRGRRDHIHAHFAFKAATAALVAARLNGSTFSFTSHGSATVYSPNRYALRTKVRYASFVVAVSEYNRRFILSHCPGARPDDVIVNRTGILPRQFAGGRGSAPAASGPLRILCVATIYPVKNHEGLIRACGRLAARGVDFILDIVGKDDHGRQPALQELADSEGIGDRVVFHGGVDHGRIPGFLDRADVCVLFSFSEGVPVSLMEAMARGVPVIGPAVTGVAELVVPGETGQVVDPHAPESLADALEALVRDPDAARAMAASASQIVAEQYDMMANARRLARVFAERIR